MREAELERGRERKAQRRRGMALLQTIAVNGIIFSPQRLHSGNNALRADDTLTPPGCFTFSTAQINPEDVTLVATPGSIKEMKCVAFQNDSV